MDLKKAFYNNAHCAPLMKISMFSEACKTPILKFKEHTSVAQLADSGDYQVTACL